ncbi:hypothetical protein AC244_33180 [Ensifer adhaerens]|uniref:Uncharacterized protein n=1 Tax=Ensifer adhaerens TaxID=106592 RepID=A0A0L8BE32_ENSAD|nr:hypothetical protein [Ensifer adhaerens]KOF12863.1 hypothetical protein AC244_33180 [Ensifer adhaerens]
MKNEFVRSAVYLALSLLKEPARKALAGTGKTHRRERSSAEAIATHVVTYLRRNWEFYRDGKPAKDRDVIQHLANIIWAVPLEIAQDHAAIDADEREAARQFIAEDVFNALTSEFQPVYAPERYTGWDNTRIR